MPSFLIIPMTILPFSTVRSESLAEPSVNSHTKKDCRVVNIQHDGRRWQALAQNCEQRLLAPSSLSVCPPPLDGFSLTLTFGISVDKTEVSLKSDKNEGHLTCKPAHIYDNISPNSSQNEKCSRQKLCSTFHTPPLPRKSRRV